MLAAIAGGVLAVPLVAQAAQPRPPQDQAEAGEDEEGPIIPDSQFEEALPPLDPELYEPLEPIEPIDPAALPPPPFPPVPGPVEEAPFAAPALAEPLPPLSTFDVEPVEQTAAEEDADAPVAIRYTLVVEGLAEVGLEDRFRDLSALEDAQGEAVNGAMIAARAEEDEALAVRLLRSEGYYDAVAASALEQLPEEGGLRVVITAAPGDRYRFGAIDIAGPETVPPGIAREALALESGAPIVAADVVAAEVEAGYEKLGPVWETPGKGPPTGAGALARAAPMPQVPIPRRSSWEPRGIGASHGSARSMG